MAELSENDINNIISRVADQSTAAAQGTTGLGAGGGY